MLYNKNMLAALEPLNVRRIEIANGYRGTEATIQEMARLVRKDAGHWYLTKIARDIVAGAGVANRDYEGEARAIFDWVKKNIRFVRDPYGMEHIQSAFKTLELGQGSDCDCHSILNAVLLSSLGFPVRFVTIKRGGPEFVHVFVETRVPRKGWMAFDTTIPESYFGWQPQGSVTERWTIGELSDESEYMGNGMGFIPLVAAGISAAVGIYQQRQAAKAAEEEAENLAAAQLAETAELERQRRIQEYAAMRVPAGTTAASFMAQYKVPLLIVGVGGLALILAVRIMRKQR